VTVAPNTGLADGDSVTVTGTGFAGTTAAYSLVQCSGLTGVAACDLVHATGGTTDGSGDFSKTYTVHTGAIGTGTCAAGSSNCYLIASTDGGGADTAFASIAFAPAPAVTVSPATNVKDGSKISVSGTGFPASQPVVYVVECSGISGSTACDLSTLATGSTNASGAFNNIKIKVHTGTVGNGTCKAGGPCYVAAATSQTPDATNSGAAKFHFAKASIVKTKTAAKAKGAKIVGTVKAGGKGISGLKTILDIRKGGHWKKVATLHTHKGGKFHSAKLKSGKYHVATPKQGKYGASTSKSVKV